MPTSLRRYLPLLATLVLAVAFLVVARIDHFAFGLRTYWPVFVMVYCLIRLAFELTARDPSGS